jgi:putative transposase
MKPEMTAQLVTDALVVAIWRRGKPDALLLHLDQDSQCTPSTHGSCWLKTASPSMSRSGNVWDNAAMESFFPSPKTERIRDKRYRTRDTARTDVFDYIERFYNTIRLHSTIGHLSLIGFEKKSLSA